MVVHYFVACQNMVYAVLSVQIGASGCLVSLAPDVIIGPYVQ